MQGMHKQFILTRYSKKSEVLIFTPLTLPACRSLWCAQLSSLCNPISISKDGCCECFHRSRLPKNDRDRAVKLHLHPHKNKYIQRKHYLLMLFEYVQGIASWGRKAAGESASNFFQLTLRGDKWSVWAAIQRDGGGGLMIWIQWMDEA